MILMLQVEFKSNITDRRRDQCGTDSHKIRTTRKKRRISKPRHFRSELVGNERRAGHMRQQRTAPRFDLIRK